MTPETPRPAGENPARVAVGWPKDATTIGGCARGTTPQSEGGWEFEVFSFKFQAASRRQEAGFHLRNACDDSLLTSGDMIRIAGIPGSIVEMGNDSCTSVQ